MGDFFSRFAPEAPLIVLDLANNHNGSVDHGKRVIEGVASVARDSGFSVAVKFQYRHLDTFIHPAFQDRLDLKYVKRFQETRLSEADFVELTTFAHQAGLQTASTPFDEHSVEWVEKHGHSFIKVASASFRDWPLWEEIGRASLPVVASTAGASFSDIDRVATFLSNRNRDFALMHCVAAYPTPDDELRLRRIEALRSRYPDVPIGYSTHEDPGNLVAAPMALTMGARILERHIGSTEQGNSLNDYSSEPQEIRAWMERLGQSIEMWGTTASDVNADELRALNDLGRAVFAKVDLKRGSRLMPEDVVLGIPRQEGQMGAEDLSKHADIRLQNDVATGHPVLFHEVQVRSHSEALSLITEQVVSLVKDSGVTLPAGEELEISHHYGLDTFSEYGMSMVTVVNREYCKKLLILLPNQEHPEQWHEIKEESFFVLHGQCHVWLDGVEKLLCPGEILLIKPRVRHRMRSTTGCIIEEVSMHHEGSDSYYSDPEINENENRKTFVKLWNFD